MKNDKNELMSKTFFYYSTRSNNTPTCHKNIILNCDKESTDSGTNIITPPNVCRRLTIVDIMVINTADWKEEIYLIVDKINHYWSG